jgi:hypothetical protein
MKKKYTLLVLLFLKIQFALSQNLGGYQTPDGGNRIPASFIDFKNKNFYTGEKLLSKVHLSGARTGIMLRFMITEIS